MANKFRARLVNLLGYGEKVTKRKDGGWTRDKYHLKLGTHSAMIKQHKGALDVRSNHVRGRQVNSSTVTVTDVSSLEEGIAIVDDLCWLLSLATQSSVMAYEYSLGRQKKWHPVHGVYNSWRPPFHSSIGKLSDFVEQAWPNYQRLKGNRPLSAFIHMLDASDLSGGLLELKIATSIQCLESIKTYFALAEGSRLGIREDRSGRFLDSSGKEISFEQLLKLTLQDVGMTLPSSFTRIKRLRNALVHRGFIREVDAVTKYIFGTLQLGAMHTAMFEVMEDTQDLLREYMLRLLGYKGDYWSYSKSGMGHRSIT
ncbi:MULTISPECIES: hypothetical protein [unclassified Bradyrhizobium]|uniref:hypothetical protein n=1 Tax=unclassified Bradyrhizobium TaxID=2631580 RepID=UPI0029164956|nr:MULTISPECIES: hypothetical protein [unclassified Bradyrhizobium]